MRRWLLVLLFSALVASLVHAASIWRDGAVCTTDADCAAWEVRNHIPEEARCYGAPCPR